MADFGAPSFSLGLDLDPDPGSVDIERDASFPAPTFRILESEDDGDDFNLDSQVAGRRGEDDPPPRALKRLKKGAAVTPSSAPPSLQSVQPPSPDEDIEDFSSDDDDPRLGVHAKAHSHPRYSSSKLPLCHQRVLNKESTAKLGFSKSASAFNSSSFGRLQSSDGQGILPSLTVSPLRKIQLLDSDSDDSSSSRCNHRKVEIEDAQSHDRQKDASEPRIRNHQNKTKFQADVPKKELYQKQISDFTTPALDDFCKEYFSSSKKNEVPSGRMEDLSVNNCKSSPGSFFDQTESISQMNSFTENVELSWRSSDPLPPSFHYYNHKDSRIRELVHRRLPNFSPIGAANQMSNQKSEVANIDYMSQFCRRDAPVSRGPKNNAGVRSTKKSKQNVAKANMEEVPQASGSWVNPRDYSTTPKDVGRRRTHANGNSRGHWFTGQDGRKVYVTKDGQELTGQPAYRHYRKESGTGFKRSRKKIVSKKKTKKR